MTQLLTLLHSSIVFGTVIMFGALGEIISEKAGNLNLGVPGIMYLGAIAGLCGPYFYELSCAEAGTTPSGAVCILISIVCAFAASALGGLIYSFLTITLRTNQNVTGLTLTIFGGGVANFFGGSLNVFAGGVGQVKATATTAAFTKYSFTLSALGANADGKGIGYLLFQHGFLTYVAVIFAVLIHLFLMKTRTGLNLRAVGENPGTADAAGINVARYKYLATCIGAGISGLGGLYYTMNYIGGTWANDGTIEALGWLAVALVIFATWRSLNALWGAYVFGIFYWMYQYIGVSGRAIELFKMLPYLVTLALLITVSMRRRKEDQPPAHLGLPYFREER
ncbi:MAG: ABC transporter permease [Oscillospiraceae bacterium]|nr:ABC transporter permease [Oscillospiraceae bacterium]